MIPLLSLILLVNSVLSPDPCKDMPLCWSENLSCIIEVKCNGNACKDVCAKGSVQISNYVLNSLKLQRKLQRDFPLAHVQMAGTHNSFINPSNDIGIEEQLMTETLKKSNSKQPIVVIANQRVSVYDQLNMGIRHLELDIQKWFLTTGSEIRICHWDLSPLYFTSLISLEYSLIHKKSLNWNPLKLGCSRLSKTMIHGLEEVKTWLNNNEQEFVAIYLDNKVSCGNLPLLLKNIFQIFGNPRDKERMILTPKDVQQKYNGVVPSINVLIRDGFRIMFENYDKAKCHEENQMARDNLFLKQSSFYEVEHRNFRPFPSCLAGERELPFSEYTNSAEPKNSDSLSHRPRALDSSLALGPDKLFDDRANGFGTDTLIKMNECGINLFAMDQVTPDSMKAFIWTWAENQPNPLFNHTYLSAETGRWYNFEYNPEYPDLCRKISNDLPTSKFHLSYDSSCFEGYEINVPRTSWENTVVRELLRSSNIDFAHLSLNDL